MKEPNKHQGPQKSFAPSPNLEMYSKGRGRRQLLDRKNITATHAAQANRARLRPDCKSKLKTFHLPFVCQVCERNTSKLSI